MRGKFSVRLMQVNHRGTVEGPPSPLQLPCMLTRNPTAADGTIIRALMDLTRLKDLGNGEEVLIDKSL